MIIACQSCNKKFDIDENLIPEKGRLLQCSSCNYKWFFKNKISVKIVAPVTINESFELFETKKLDINNPNDVNNRTTINTTTNQSTEKVVKKSVDNKNRKQKKNNFFNTTIVFIISFVALIILLDTFKNPLSKIVPNLEFLLYNLYESIKDIALFINDLI